MQVHLRDQMTEFIDLQSDFHHVLTSVLFSKDAGSFADRLVKEHIKHEVYNAFLLSIANCNYVSFW